MSITAFETSVIKQRRLYLGCAGIALALHALMLFAFKVNFDLPHELEPELSGIEVNLEASFIPATAPATNPKDKPVKPAQAAPASLQAKNTPKPAHGNIQQNITSGGNKKEMNPSPEHTPEANDKRNKDQAGTNNANKAKPIDVKAQTAALPPQALPHNPKPPYPELSRKRGQEGVVVLWVNIGAEGEAVLVEVYRSSGYPLLDESALSTVKKWRFKVSPHNIPSSARELLLPVEFRLK